MLPPMAASRSSAVSAGATYTEESTQWWPASSISSQTTARAVPVTITSAAVGSEERSTRATSTASRPFSTAWTGMSHQEIRSNSSR